LSKCYPSKPKDLDKTEVTGEGSTKFRGRKPNGSENPDLNDPDQLAKAILKTLPKQ
jgi:hypothetical protein